MVSFWVFLFLGLPSQGKTSPFGLGLIMGLFSLMALGMLLWNPVKSDSESEDQESEQDILFVSLTYKDIL